MFYLLTIVLTLLVMPIALVNAQGTNAVPNAADPDACTPAIPSKPTRGLFLWKDCDGRWHARAGSVGNSGRVRVVGSIVSSNDFSNVIGYDLEQTDWLDSSNPKQILIDFAFISPEYDGLDFDVPTGSQLCVDLSISDGNLPVAVGRQRRPLLGKFNPETFAPCS